MAGLDTRGFSDGFLRGFEVMDRHQARKDQQQRADQQDRRAEERFQWQKDQAETAGKEREEAKDLQTIQFTLGKIAQGMDVSEDELAVLQKYPRFHAAFDPASDAALAQAQAVMDPSNPASLNQPESIEALNQLFAADINKGGGGRKRIVAAVPGPDGESLNFELEVVGEDGQAYRAPMTQGREPGGDDDIVMNVPVGRLIEATQGIGALRKAFSTPQAQEQASRLLQVLRGEPSESWEQVEGPDGSVFQRNARTGEMRSLLGRRPRSSGSSYYNRPTATQRDLQFLVDNGVAPDLKTAWEMFKNRGDDGYERGQDEIQYIEGRLEEISDIMGDRVALSQMSDADRDSLLQEQQQLRARRDNVASSLFGSSSSSAPQGSPQPSGSGQESPQAASEESPATADDILSKFL
ncbi:hypothetical protein KUW00_15530 [Halomonas sp. DP5N14-9]|uniref:hypothetical protein n=1 Tax=Halomonas sp. DP5N14-9 TaxID=2859075 RepID=UPI001C9A153B|nr:hypothetical protein [Halomonas sp. DP5N14-9]MBY5942290.1 hypothetical protein [Halomonas sp. DP5N14-9]